MTSETKESCGANRRLLRWWAALVAAAVLGGCAVTSTRQAPVAERSTTPATRPAAPPPAAAPAPPRVAAADGTYMVQPGDTLFSIAAAFGQDVKDLARWNSIDDPSRIRVGQTLRVVPPRSETAAVLPVTPTGPAVTKPLDGSSAAGTAAPAPAVEPSTVPGPVASIPETKPPAAAPSADWIWPVDGKVTEKFDEKRNKGIGIAAKEGDPVVASADGQVVYSGSGLRGYGNLVILKHSDDFISAYAHNRQILVKQGQMVKRGQRIAEVGKSDTTQPKLHFEIRRQGKPVDPLAYLPPR
ncbi:MAG: peptidoglycan DD-metalloendopeptidase family protein [Burkholderiales bacterium]|nr:MAG: peptidoglycan DD-metalloendopeptidase family protein [Burkholderiales bacterium]